ncbi:MAG: class A beta-lactamase [Betaproteobacteria bacterium HGW-Betaproteobacteria-16]|nr:MAG: class A beta-lactamase [Betaproteobacteria bacterium HGW-Betaproteobacteria-16]
MLQRRHFGIATAFSLAHTLATFPTNTWGNADDGSFHEQIAALEVAARCRLGVYIIDTATGREYGHRPDERFMMLSSFKLLASALVLARAEQGQDSLQRRIRYTREDLVTWSPVTEKHVGGEGLTLAQLCEATITTSDNTAANLILASYGGPAAVTAFARKLGDTVTRLDRTEPELNRPSGAAPLDTTTPRAMTRTLQTLLIGNALAASSRHTLLQWLKANTTGDKRLRAGAPADWAIGEKTGTNRTDANDIGIAWPPGRAPLLVSAYLAESTAPAAARDAALAGVGRLMARL